MADGNTKEQILKVGLRLLRKQSYNSFSFGDIAAEVGIKKASIHYYFPTKEVLGVALVQYYHELIRSYINQIEPDTPPRDQLVAFVEFFKIGLQKKYLCPAGVLSIEFFTLSQEMQDELRLLFNYYLDWLTEVCKQGQQQGDFNFDGDPRDMAFHISSSIEGATAMARAYDTVDLYYNSLDLLLSKL